MNYGYIRVSSDRQTVENQRFEILKLCEREKITIDEWIEETVSGTQQYSKRRLGKLLKRVKEGDLIICSELSRLGRTLYMIMEILSLCMKRGCRVWTIKDAYRLGDDIQSKVLAFAFGLSAEIERNLISQRTREALARLKAEGRHVGRPYGAHTCQVMHVMYRYDKFIRRRLEDGVPVCKISDELHCNRNTLRRYIKRYIRNNETHTSS
ncbi:MAG: master DNA invertase Mpi family serine-type recombinase [Paludibacteraceae bacterium]|nr:master DNA invertase Mpi family serine-type recombinase [Paludibacteraceae bacterium]